MRRNHRHAADLPKVSGNRDGERGAFFGIGGRAQFIEQHERLRSCSARNEIDVGDVGGESRKILLDRLIVADIGEHGVEDRQLGAVGGHWNSRLCHQRQETDRFQRYRFTAGVGTGDDELAACAFEFDCDRDNRRVLELKISL